MAGFLYTPQFVTSIERTVTRERLKRYLTATGNDIVRAVQLYELNVALSESLYGFLHGLEVAIRNAMHYELTVGIGDPKWYDKQTLQLNPYHRDRIDEAKSSAGGPGASAGKVIAELMFGFWSDLTGQSYHHKLWMPYIRKAFRHGAPHRPFVHNRLQRVRWLRNRIAHHEPILTAQNRVYTGHQMFLTLPELLESASWICTDTASWLATTTRYSEAMAILQRVSVMGITL